MAPSVRRQDHQRDYYATQASNRLASSSERPSNGHPAARHMTSSPHQDHQRNNLAPGHVSYRHAEIAHSSSSGCPSYCNSRSNPSSSGQLGGLEKRRQQKPSRELSHQASLETESHKRAYDHSSRGGSTSRTSWQNERNLAGEPPQDRRRRLSHDQHDDTPAASSPLSGQDLRHTVLRRNASQHEVKEPRHQKKVTMESQHGFTKLPPASSASADDRLERLLQLWLRQAQHSRCCPFSFGGLAELKRIDPREYEQIAPSWALPLDPSLPSAKPLCTFNNARKNQTRHVFLTALQDHADSAGAARKHNDGVDNDDDDDGDDDDDDDQSVRSARSGAHYVLAEMLRTLTRKVAPATRQPVPEQTFLEKIPWPPLLLVTRLPADFESSMAALATLLGGHEPSAVVRVANGSLANTAVLGFGGDDGSKAYKSATQLLARSCQPSDIGAVRWLDEADLGPLKAEDSARQLFTFLAEQRVARGGAAEVEWVPKATKERQLFEEKSLRHVEAERKQKQLEEERQNLVLELDALRKSSKELEVALDQAMSEKKELAETKAREERKLMEDRHRNELEMLQLEKQTAYRMVAAEKKKTAHLNKQLEQLRKSRASADLLTRKANELLEVRTEKIRLENKVFDTTKAITTMRQAASEVKEHILGGALLLHSQLCELEAKLNERLVDEAVSAKIAGRIDWKQLKKLGFRCEAKSLPPTAAGGQEGATRAGAKRAGATRAGAGADALLRQEVRVLQSRFWASLLSVEEDEFHPKRAFKQTSDGQWNAIREDDETELVGTHSVLIKASWVQMVRFKYGKKAEGILQYLLKTFNEFCADAWSRSVNSDMTPVDKLKQLP